MIFKPSYVEPEIWNIFYDYVVDLIERKFGAHYDPKFNEMVDVYIKETFAIWYAGFVAGEKKVMEELKDFTKSLK